MKKDAWDIFDNDFAVFILLLLLIGIWVKSNDMHVKTLECMAEDMIRIQQQLAESQERLLLMEEKLSQMQDRKVGKQMHAKILTVMIK